MQALVVVLQHDLPVGLHLHRGDVPDLQLGQAEPGQVHGVVLLVLEVLDQWPRLLAREVDEDEPLPDVGVHRPQGGRRPVDLLLLDHRRGDQSPVQGVAPRVVRTADVAARVALLVVAQPGSPVPADVVEAADLVVLPAHDQQALATELDPHPRPRSLEAFRSSDVDPVAVEDPLLVEAVRLLRVVRRAGQCLPDRLGDGHRDSFGGNPRFANCTVSQRSGKAQSESAVRCRWPRDAPGRSG